MRTLVIFWKQYKMSKYVAGKAQCEGKKEYTIKQRSSQFPATTPLADAIRELHERFGMRPENENPFNGICVEHSFAEYVSHTYIECPF